MKINVLFFGAAADSAETREVVFETLTETAGSVVNEIVAAFPVLAKHKLQFALNESYVDRTAKLRDGDELAIFTAVSGG